MTIYIPDEVLDNELRTAFRKMPPTPNINPEGKRKSSPVLHYIGHVVRRTGNLCITIVLIYRALRDEIERRGIIIYDPKADTWQGVDYDGD